MKITSTIPKNYEAKYLQVSAGVRYWEDAEVNGTEDTEGNLIPCRNGDRWEPKINIETGKIINWEQGKIASVHYKVCDDGQYTLIDDKGEVIKEIDNYVISALSVDDNGHGDYIYLTINVDGFIQNWNASLLQSDFETSND